MVHSPASYLLVDVSGSMAFPQSILALHHIDGRMTEWRGNLRIRDSKTPTCRLTLTLSRVYFLELWLWWTHNTHRDSFRFESFGGSIHHISHDTVKDSNWEFSIFSDLSTYHTPTYHNPTTLHTTKKHAYQSYQSHQSHHSYHSYQY